MNQVKKETELIDSQNKSVHTFDNNQLSCPLLNAKILCISFYILSN